VSVDTTRPPPHGAPTAFEVDAWACEVSSLRGEVLGGARLAERAASLADFHGAPDTDGRSEALLGRFAETQAQIREAYAYLSREVRAVRDPTPAEEWLLDNAHVVEDQLREVEVDLPRGYLRELPRLGHGMMRDHPRVYALCVDYVCHTDARAELETLTRYVDGYQSKRALTIGELWAVPIMLRLGLLMIVARIAKLSAEDAAHTRARRVAARIAADPARAVETLRALPKAEVTETFLVDLWHAVRQFDVDPSAVADFVAERARGFGASVEDLSRQQHLRRAEDQLTVGNCVTSMRTLSAYEWTTFFESVSRVEALLRRDPDAVYAASDRATRDRCRHALERIARHGGRDEEEVARVALDLATASADRDDRDVSARHVGCYLGGPRQPELEGALGVSPRLLTRLRRAVERNALPLYVGGVAALTALAVVPFARSLRRRGVSPAVVAALAAPFSLAAADVSVGLMNALVVAVFPPRLLAKYEFKREVPEAHRTLVVVPALLDSLDTVARLLADLEVRALGNTDDELFFALLTDFCDAPSALDEGDDALLAAAREGITRLNTRSPREGEGRFHLLHRGRQHNPSQRCYMSWERKRGKLDALNRLLLGEASVDFDVVTASDALLRGVRYVITLDADTQLPRDVARKLVATIAHPMNRPQLDEALGRVTRGYGIIQPRVGVVPESSRRSWYARILSGAPGIDPYTSAVSDVYQDLFGEASFVGKGVYDVRAFSASLAGRVPDNTLLSHDLFEGIFARAGLASDIEVLDAQPASYAVDARRQHRWIRGDFQLIPWLFGAHAARGPVPALGRWKMVDNLRRASLPGALVALVSVAAVADATAPAWTVAALVGVLFSPLLVRAIAGATRTPPQGTVNRWPGLYGDLRANAFAALVRGCFLLDGALLAGDAMVRTAWRLGVSRRDLLEWTSTHETERLTERPHAPGEARLWFGAALSTAGIVALAWAQPRSLVWLAAPLASWAVTPWLEPRLRRPRHAESRRVPLAAEHRASFRRVARRTWRFFETFVGPEDHGLPPDNYQREPRGVVAHRTSPTNIGLYLLSCLAARDLGYITLRGLVDRVDATLDAVGRLRLERGHLLNWYDTRTLEPLPPAYVSTVDSGNLAGHLWTLFEGLDEALDAPLDPARCLDAVDDALRLARAAGADITARADAVTAARGALDGSLAVSIRALAELRVALALIAARAESAEAAYWSDAAVRSAATWSDEAHALAPFLDLVTALTPEARAEPSIADSLERLSHAVTVRALLDATTDALPHLDAASAVLAPLARAVRDGRDDCARLFARLRTTGARARAVADAMDFRFLFDDARSLFAIGYNVETGLRDAAHYDLLASEARLASFVAIAKGDVREAHWFHLGRSRVPAGDSASLVSWSGSMFEFLMPLLVMKRREGTLLDETYDSVVAVQKGYGDERDIPWGVSESAYNVMDLSMTYQYRAFGIQSLGLKSGLADDVVIAPYATALAAMVRPDLAAENLARLARDGVEGPYGFYESVDYTPERVPPGRRGVIVKTFMAHHQAMSLVALCNVLLDGPMPRRFHRHPRVQATELLLEERLPRGIPLLVDRAVPSPPPLPQDGDLHHVERATLDDAPTFRAHLLGQGELASLLGVRGFGFIAWRGLDVHRVRGAIETDPSGLFVYVRDVATSKLWSIGFEPTRAAPDAYHAELAPDRVRIHRRDGDVESAMELVVSPEHPCDLRRITLTNLGAVPVELELTSWLELSLVERGADLAHPAFAGMFIETDFVDACGALLAHRRAKRPGDLVPWCAQSLQVEHGEAGDLDYETSREAFLGRGGTLAAPAAALRGGPLGRATGYVLDAGFALRRTVHLAPGARARLNLITALSDHREGALAILEALSSTSGVERTCELAWADARVELKHIGVSAVASFQFQRLLSAILSPEERLRVGGSQSAEVLDGRGVLWSLGVAGDIPLVIVRLDDAGLTELCREALLAHEFLRVNHFQFELLLLDEEPAAYLAPRHERALQIVRATGAQGRLDQRGGVFLRSTAKLSPAERSVVLSAARVVFAVSLGSMARQLRRPLDDAESRDASASVGAITTAREGATDGLFANGLGDFSPDGREYRLALSAARRTPAPWSNVLAGPTFGALVTESLGGFTWSDNSQRRRVTPWSNDPVSDPAGESLYLRDESDGRFVALTGPDGAWSVRHGQGYSVFERTWETLDVTVTVFLDPDHPAKIYRVELVNRGAARTLSLFACVDWVLGAQRERSEATVVTRYDATTRSLLAADHAGEHPSRCGFLCASGVVRSVTGDRREFYGTRRGRASPRALSEPALSGRVGGAMSPCGAMQVSLDLGEGARLVTHLALGEALDANDAHLRCAALTRSDDLDARFDRARAVWDELLGRVQVRTPDAALDVMMNRWLIYQTLGARVWGRSGFYQSGGAYGFRDQLQDVLALLYARPELARAHLLRAAARQFVEGDVQHWWHPDTGEGVRTRCSDDMLWLAFATTRYVEVTGDRAVLDEAIPFLRERPLATGEHDLYTVPAITAERATLYEHCLRALRTAAPRGPHGLPLMGAGDWNDGMDRVGERGVGETVWLGFFLARVWTDFAALAASRGDLAVAAEGRADAIDLGAHLEAGAWDGRWYRRAYTDDGHVLGSSESPECRIDAIAQAWSALSGVAREDRALMAVDSALDALVMPDERIMLLLEPAFTGVGLDPGYIAAYPPGVRENGGQYTHGVLWVALALCKQGRGERAWALLQMLNPVRHGDSAAHVARYRVEPYAVAADVYGPGQHLGRGGWTWYTGAAGWMYRITLESLLGVEVRGETLSLVPCPPPSWRGYSVTMQRGASTYVIEVENPEHLDPAASHLEVTRDGEPVDAAQIPFGDDGLAHALRARFVATTTRPPTASPPA
jgi:cyclic beta-1,2-glucan synthetase